MIGPVPVRPRHRHRERLPGRAGDELVITVSELYNLHDVTARFPVGGCRLWPGHPGPARRRWSSTASSPPSAPRWAAAAAGHVRSLDLGGIRHVAGIDATPIGQNARSIPATYSGAWDHIRRRFADTPAARRRRWTPGHFSFNTRAGQCPTCRGLGNIDLDVQYLPDINVICPTCRGARFNEDTLTVTRRTHRRRRARADRRRGAGSVRRPGSDRAHPAPDLRGRPRLSRLGSRRPRCPAARRSGCGSPRGCAAASATPSTSSMNRRPGCIRWTSAPCWRCSIVCSTTAPRSWYRPRPRPARGRRPRDRHGTGRRARRRPDRRLGYARGGRGEPRQRHRPVAGGCRRAHRGEPFRVWRALTFPATRPGRREVSHHVCACASPCGALGVRLGARVSTGWGGWYRWVATRNCSGSR